MKKKDVILRIVAVAILGAIGYMAFYASGGHGNVDTTKFMLALQRYCAEKRAAGVQLPSEISVRELVAHGYLSKEDVRGFEKMEVVISLDADETKPQQILVRARLPDGTVQTLMGDGSVQQLGR